MKAFVVVILCALPVSLVSADPQSTELVGHWRFIRGGGRHDITFVGDGTFNSSWIEKGKIRYQFNGKWSLHGNKIVYKKIQSPQGKLPPNYRDEDQVSKLTRASLVTQATTAACGIGRGSRNRQA